MKKNNDTKDYSEQLEFLNSQPYYASNLIMQAKNCYPVVRFSGTPYRLVPTQKSTADTLFFLIWTYRLINKMLSYRSETALQGAL